jgi:superoxide dismutase, Cu-Zn family
MTRLRLLAAALMTAIALPVAAQDGAATAVLMDLSGATLGTLTLMDMDGGIHISGELTGVPNGDHGFHIHENGSCDAEGKFESAGGHFEPGDHKHGTENPDGPHAGDLLNVTADDDGKATVDLHNMTATIAAGDNSIKDVDGAALVLHADPDDYKTDPSGNSGDRIACGVIEFAP